MKGDASGWIDPRGVRTDYAYNAFDQVTQVTRAAAVNASYGQSPPELAEAPLEAFAFATQTVYDGNGQSALQAVLDPDHVAGCGDSIDTYSCYDILDNKTSDTLEIAAGQFAMTRYYYDADRRLVLTVFPQGNAEYTEYDAAGRVWKQVRGIDSLNDDLTAAQRAKIVRPPAALGCQLEEAEPSVATYVYDDEAETPKGYLLSVLDPEGHQTAFEYDEFGRRVKTTDPLGNYDVTVYDLFGRVTETKHYDSDDTLMTRTAYVYDDLGQRVQTKQLLTASPETWLVTETEYDAMGRVVQTTSPDGAVTGQVYDGAGRVIKTLDPVLRTESGQPVRSQTENWFDDAGDLIETKRTDASTLAGTNAETFKTTLVYDSLGRLQTQIDNMGQTTDFRYDRRGLMLAMADANGPNAAARTFHRRGEATGAVSCNDFGNVALFEYDGAGRKTKESRILTPTGLGDGRYIGRTTRGAPAPTPLPDTLQDGGDGIIDVLYEYNANGALAALVDDNGNRTQWLYDAQNRKVAETKGCHQAPNLADRFDDPTVIVWSYDRDGLPQYMSKEDETILEYQYDAGHRLTGISATPALGVVGTTEQSFSYDAAGRRLSAFDNNFSGTTDDVTATWSYDMVGRVGGETLRIGASGPVRTIESEYTDTRRSAIVYPNGRRVDLDWEATGALKSTGDEGEAPVAVYDWIGGRVLWRQMDNGVNLDMRNGSGTWYDAAGRPLRYAHVDINQEGEPVLIGFEHTYDRVGNKLSQTSIHDPKDSQRYAYDSTSRLTSFVRGTIPSGQGVDPRCDPPSEQPWSGMTQAQEWDLDGVGNWSLTRTKVGDVTTPESREDTNFNEYVEVGGEEQTYDDNGNLVDDGAKQYAWDAFNRLRIATDGVNTLGTYLYDATNRRVRKILPGAAPDTDFYYDGWQILEEHENAAANPSRQFVYGVYVDEPLVMDVNSNADSTCIGSGDNRYFYHGNTIYSIYALTDSAGVLAEAYEYDPYGRHWLISPGQDEEWFTADDTRTALAVSTVGNPYTFTGREFDAETGLHCYRNRYYACAPGRFLSRDSQHTPSSFQLYIYCDDRATLLLDPFGLKPSDNSETTIALRNDPKYPWSITVRTIPPKTDWHAGGTLNKRDFEAHTLSTSTFFFFSRSYSVKTKGSLLLQLWWKDTAADSVTGENAEEHEKHHASIYQVEFGSLFGVSLDIEKLQLCNRGTADCYKDYLYIMDRYYSHICDWLNEQLDADASSNESDKKEHQSAANMAKTYSELAIADATKKLAACQKGQ